MEGEMSFLSDSNQRPTDYKSVALPAELRKRMGGFSFSNFIDNDLIQDVIDRMNNLYCEGCGDEYKEALKLFNKNWEIDKKRTRRI